MAVDMFLIIDGVKGESVDAKHKEAIDVLAWSWGMAQSGTTHMGSGGGSGKVSVQDLSITKYIDKSSPVLAVNCCNGKHIPKADLIIRKAGEKPLEYVKISMEDLLVTHVSLGGSGGEDRLTENITLNFAKFKYVYTTQAKDGGKGPEVEGTWNIAKGEK